MSRLSQQSDGATKEAVRVPPAVLYYGSDKPEPGRRILSAGPVRMVYEAGELRYIRMGDREIVRRTVREAERFVRGSVEREQAAHLEAHGTAVRA